VIHYQCIECGEVYDNRREANDCHGNFMRLNSDYETEYIGSVDRKLLRKEHFKERYSEYDSY
jgi:hypothetical protein